MKSGFKFALAAMLVVGVIGCGGVPGNPMDKDKDKDKNGGGGGSKMPPMPTMSPFMYAKDFSKYEAGKWVEYNMGTMSTKISCVGKDGDTTWIQVGMKMSGMAYDHLLKVGADGKVSKAWFSSKGYDAWEECKINESATGTTGKTPTDCPACKKPVADHKKPDIQESEEAIKVGDKDVTCTKLAMTMYKCDGSEAAKGTYWYGADVPELHQMYSAMLKMLGKEDLGGLAKMEMGASKVACDGFGTDAKPKHELPKE